MRERWRVLMDGCSSLVSVWQHLSGCKLIIQQQNTAAGPGRTSAGIYYTTQGGRGEGRNCCRNLEGVKRKN